MKEEVKQLIARAHGGDESPELLETLCKSLIREGYGKFRGLVFFEGEIDWVKTLMEMQSHAKEMASVVVQFWEESERGWGTRPDGCSVHLTEEDCKQFTREYMQKQRQRLGEAVPEEYERTQGRPQRRMVPLQLLKDLKEAKEEGKSGLRLWKPDTAVMGLYSPLSKVS